MATKRIHLIHVLAIALGFFSRVDAGENNGRGTRAIALANSVTATALDAWSIYYNPAALRYLSNAHAAVFYAPQQFGLEELQTSALVGSFPTAIGGVGIHADQFGYELYKELSIGLGAGLSVAEGFAVGLRVGVTRTTIARYGAANTLNVDLGLLNEVAENLLLGFVWKNMNRPTLGRSNERLPQLLSLGLAYQFDKSFALSAAIEKETMYPESVRLGAEYSLHNFIAIRGGISTNPETFSFGIGIHNCGVEFGYAAVVHDVLGWTHQVEVGILLPSIAK
ncbi:MAG: hypothetical protein HY966_01470 [Ignavibacteriales bacterium]|nr:hypothetical protein [Ignavibacteriales bacterium]